MLRPVFFLIAFAALAAGQAPGQTARFDVVSIKPNNSGLNGSSENTSHGRLTMMNDTPNALIQMAFRVKDFEITGGPGWLSTAHYDISATTGNTDSLTEEQLGVVLQSLLADRFGGKVHRETKESTVYSLVVARGGPKMTVDTGDGGSSANTNSSKGRTSIVVKQMPADWIASRLEGEVGRRVTDKTGLTGRYDFTLTWAQDQSVDPAAPSIFTAVQEQLGLKLDSVKGPVDMVVIDSIEKPSEN